MTMAVLHLSRTEEGSWSSRKRERDRERHRDRETEREIDTERRGAGRIFILLARDGSEGPRVSWTLEAEPGPGLQAPTSTWTYPTTGQPHWGGSLLCQRSLFSGETY